MGNEMLLSALPLTAATDLRSRNARLRPMDDRRNAEDGLLVDHGDDDGFAAGALAPLHPSLAKWLDPHMQALQLGGSFGRSAASTTGSFPAAPLSCDPDLESPAGFDAAATGGFAASARSPKKSVAFANAPPAGVA